MSVYRLEIEPLASGRFANVALGVMISENMDRSSNFDILLEDSMDDALVELGIAEHEVMAVHIDDSEKIVSFKLVDTEDDLLCVLRRQYDDECENNDKFFWLEFIAHSNHVQQLLRSIVKTDAVFERHSVVGFSGREYEATTPLHDLRIKVFRDHETCQYMLKECASGYLGLALKVICRRPSQLDHDK